MKKEEINLKRFLVIALCLAVFSTMLPACSSGNSDAAPPSSSTPAELNIVSAANSVTPGFDPQIDYQGSLSVGKGICETLFKLNNNTMAIESYLADSYKQTDDLTWTITIKDGITFSNGTALDAAAVKSALEYTILGNKRIEKLLNVSSMEADGQVLTIKTTDPVAILPNILTDGSTMIYDTKAGSDYTQTIIGTGPYVLESMDSEGNCKLVKNETYWQGEPGVDIVNTKWVVDNSAKVLALQSGEIDYNTVPAADLSLFQNNEDYTITSYDTHRTYFLFVNLNSQFTADDALREALSYSIDRDSIIQSVFSGTGTKTTACFPAWSGYSDGVSAEEYNLDTAKQILEDAGYTDTNGDGNIEKDGQEVKLNILTYSGNAEFPVLCEVIQAKLKELGIASTIKITDSFATEVLKDEWDIATYGYNTLSMGDSYNFLYPIFDSEGTGNFSHYSNAKVDALLDEMSQTADVDKRKALSIEVQKYAFEENAHIFILHLQQNLVVRAGVENVEPNAGNNADMWKITKTAK